MTGNASGKFESIQCYVPDISQDMSVPGIQVGIVGFREVHFIVLKEIVTWNEVIRVWEPGRPGPCNAQMTLSASRLDRLGIFPALFGKEDQRGVVSVFKVHIAVTCVAVESKRRKSSCPGIYSGRMTTSTLIGELVSIPSWFRQTYPLRRLLVGAEHCLRGQYREFAITCLLQKSNP